jgi:hypothetical protein
VAPLRCELEAEARATIRFEMPPGQQLQIDFGERRTLIGGENVRVYLFVATLAYWCRIYVWASHFGGVPAEESFDNDHGLIAHYDRLTRRSSSTPA